MNPWAQDRTHQLDTQAMTAFGIRIVSRHANAQEMIELIEFARAAACANVNMFVPEAFYDSGSGCCSFKLSAALETISQFLWFGGVRHGRPMHSEPP